jgi:Spy/CpxP family protein refolding chaperone
MKSCRHWKLLVAAILAISTTEVTAQDRGRALAFRTGGESPNDPTYLLASKSVQKELALTDSQKASFQKLRDTESSSHPFSGGALIGQSQEDIQKKLEQHATENRSRVFNLLTPQQIARLNEINIQVAGVAALSFVDVAEKLGLTAEQKTKLKTLAGEARRKQDDLNATTNGKPVEASKRPAYKQKLDQITAERKKQAFAVLTDDQQAKFKKLQGKNFDTSTIQPSRKSFSSHGRIGGPAQSPKPNESTIN